MYFSILGNINIVLKYVIKHKITLTWYQYHLIYPWSPSKQIASKLSPNWHQTRSKIGDKSGTICVSNKLVFC